MPFLLFLWALGHRDLVRNAVWVIIWHMIETRRKSQVEGSAAPCLLQVTMSVLETYLRRIIYLHLRMDGRTLSGAAEVPPARGG